MHCSLVAWPPIPSARSERRASRCGVERAGTQASGPAGRSPEGRGGGRASAALPLLDDATTSPASRRLASARPALAPKCTPYVLTGLYLGGTPSKGLKVAITGLKSTVMSITHSS